MYKLLFLLGGLRGAHIALGGATNIEDTNYGRRLLNYSASSVVRGAELKALYQVLTQSVKTAYSTEKLYQNSARLSTTVSLRRGLCTTSVITRQLRPDDQHEADDIGLTE